MQEEIELVYVYTDEEGLTKTVTSHMSSESGLVASDVHDKFIEFMEACSYNMESF